MKKRELLRRNTLYGLILAWAMLVVSPYVSGAPPGNASASSDRAARHADLVAKYGLTKQQLQQRDKLVDEMNSAIKAVNENPSLSKEERNKRIGVHIHDFEKKMSSVLNREQYDKWMSENRRVKEQVAQAEKALTAQIHQIRKSDIPYPQKQEQIAAAKAEYLQKVATAKGGQQAGERKLEQRHARNMMAIHHKRAVKMSFSQTQQLESLAGEKDRQLAELRAKKLPKPRHNTERDKIMAEYENAVRKTLGDQKYAQWDKNRNLAMDRNLKSRYGMTPKQIAELRS